MKNIVIYYSISNTHLMTYDRNLKNWIDFLNKFDTKNIKLHYFFHILNNKNDTVPKENEHNDLFRKNIFEQKESIYTYYLTNEKVFSEYLTIFHNIDEYLKNKNIDYDDTFLFYLEDDWSIQPNLDIDINILFSKYLFSIPLGYFSLFYNRNNFFWTFKPFLCSYKLWKKYIYEPIYTYYKTNSKGDTFPSIVKKYFQETFSNVEDIYNLTIINKSIQQDFFTNQAFINYSHSYYTYLSPSYNIYTNDKYLDEEISNVVKNEVTFIRITPSIIFENKRNINETTIKKIEKKEVLSVISSSTIKKSKEEITSLTNNSIQNTNIVKLDNKKNVGQYPENSFSKNTEEISKNGKKNILYLVDKNIYVHKMSRVRFHAIHALGNIANVFFWGPNWNGFIQELSLNDNIKSLSILIDYIICYKPDNIKGFIDCIIPKCVTYNEMWDEPLTLREINTYRCDLIVCHHENDKNRYTKDLFKSIVNYNRLVHIPHCTESFIFYDRNIGLQANKIPEEERKKIIDVLLCGSIGRHYPLRQRLREVIKIMPKKYICKEYTHPGYNHSDSFTNVYLNDFAETICKSKICITCTSKYKYRLGKMVEIPMCGSVLACDLPEQDQEEFKKIMIVLDDKMSNEQIKNLLVEYLENPLKLEEIRLKGLEWSKQYVQSYYANNLLKELNSINIKTPTIFLIGDELTSIKNKWICDILKEEFIEYSGLKITKNPKDADIIWLLAPWSHRKIPADILKNKFVITSIHHIDWNKYDENLEYYKYIDSITNRYHTICPKSRDELVKITKKPIITTNFWINEKNYYKMNNKLELKKKWSIPSDKFIIGSFQKDTEGKDEMTPKLCKGPDILIEILKDMKYKKMNVHVVLTGWRRNYIIKELEKLEIPYVYNELVSLEELNELYNCLDLYLVSSRVEGGPRAILECGLTKVPIISTDVGISELILPKESIFDMNQPMSYTKAKPNIPFAYLKSSEYSIKNYMKTFINRVFYELQIFDYLFEKNNQI